MANASAIRAGRAFVEITAKDKLSKVLNGIKRGFGGFVKVAKMAFKAFAAALAVAVGAAVTAVKTFAKVGDEIHKASLRTGLGAEELSELKHAADEADVSFKALQNGIFRAQRTRPGKSMAELADEVANAGDEAAQAQKAYEIFGKQGQELLPMLKGGSAALREQQKEARRLGLILTDEDAAAAAELTDQLGALAKQIKFVFVRIGSWITRNTDLINSLKIVSEWLGDILTFLKNDDLGKAWEITWKGMALVTLEALKEMITPFQDFINEIINMFMNLQNQITNIAANVVQAFNPAMAQQMRLLAGQRQAAVRANIGAALNNQISSLQRRINTLQAQAAGARGRVSGPGGGGGGGAMGAGAFGTFDPSMVLRMQIGITGHQERTAKATERTATAAERIAAVVERAQRRAQARGARLAWR